jgi:hypothetical protein
MGVEVFGGARDHVVEGGNGQGMIPSAIGTFALLVSRILRTGRV